MDGDDGSATFIDSGCGPNNPHSFSAVETAELDTSEWRFAPSSLLLDGR